MPEEYIQPFCMSSGALVKAIENTDGLRQFHGPIAPPDQAVDYDKDVLTKAGVESGLIMYANMGRHVDWAHMYPKTKLARWLIGEGTDKVGPDGWPWLQTTITKANDVANDAWEHIQSGAHCGYSIYGVMKKRDDADKRKLVQTEIHLITADPRPKGFGNFLLTGPMPDAMALAKSVVADVESGDFESSWIHIQDYTDFDASDLFALSQDRQIAVVKALMGTDRSDREGALREVSGDQVRCKNCGTKNKKARHRCRTCGGLQGHIGFDGLVSKLKAEGKDEEYARAIAAKVGDEKYGKAAMERGARENKPVTKSMTTGSTIVGAGVNIGGSALRGQDLLGTEQLRCKHCRRKNHHARKKCVGCGRALL